MALKNGKELQQWEIAVAKQLIGKYRRQSQSPEREEFDDLLQECLMHWIDVRRKFRADPNGPPIGYMATVIRNKLTDLFRERVAAKRAGDYDAVSLDAPTGDSDDAPTFADLLDAARGRDAAADQSLDPEDARIDVARALRNLTPRQRRLCELLGEERLSIKEAAEKLRIPRGTLYEEINRIRKIFADQGLGDYLRK